MLESFKNKRFKIFQIIMLHKILAFFLGYFAFRILPVAIGHGEFSGASLNDIAVWFLNVSSGIAYLVCGLIYIGLLFILKINKKVEMYSSSIIFGAAYSVFEFPLSLIARWIPSYDWLGIIAHMQYRSLCVLSYWV